MTLMLEYGNTYFLNDKGFTMLQSHHELWYPISATIMMKPKDTETIGHSLVIS